MPDVFAPSPDLKLTTGGFVPIMTAVPPPLHYWGTAILFFTIVTVLFGDLLPDPVQEAAQVISTFACLMFVGFIVIWCAQ